LPPPIYHVYQCTISKILRIARGRRLVYKETTLYEPYDPRIEVLGDVIGKVEQEKILDLNLTDVTLFPQMNIDVF